MKPLAHCQLYTFVDTAYLHGRAPEAVAEQLCQGGSDIIQLRAKNSTPREIRAMAEKILPITRAAGVGLVINDEFDIARSVGAEFCHLGQEDFLKSGFRNISEFRVSAAEIRIGLSTHAPGQARHALAAGADYIAVGPVYATGTKPGVRPVTVECVRWASANVTAPWFAIGGINLDTLDAVLLAGARRVCVVSAILNAPDPAEACAEFKRRINSSPVQNEGRM